MDDFRATNRPATALLADDEGNFERASHHDHFACATCFEVAVSGCLLRKVLQEFLDSLDKRRELI